jgi:pimeloyl-ACP methyl ester carboxylesterase
MRPRHSLTALAAIFVLAAGGTYSAIQFGDAPAPPHMTEVSGPFKRVDFRDLPQPTSTLARDGTKLVYREYPGSDPTRLVMLVHGSSGNGVGMHPLARAIAARGPTVWALAVRGHGGSGRRGDIDYIGQLDDDTEDLAKAARATQPDRKLTLLGFSAGGGYALHVGGGNRANLFERVVLLAPYLGYGSGTDRKRETSDGKVWATPFMTRIFGLMVANAAGVHAYDGLPVIAFAIDPAHAQNLAGTYSWRLLQAFGPGRDAFAELKRAPHPPEVWIGDKDELIDPDAVRTKVLAVRPDARITTVPGVGHIGLTVDPDSVARIAETF